MTTLLLKRVWLGGVNLNSKGGFLLVLLIFRTLVVYGIITACMRLMGKRQLGELQPSELVSTLLLSNLVSVPIESPEIPLLSTIVPVLLLVSLEVLVSALCARHRGLETALSGSAQILIRDGVIDQRVLRELRFSADDLLCALRLKDVFSPGEVALCLVETNGNVSVCKKADAPAWHMSLPVLVSGRFNEGALAACGMTQAEAIAVLRTQNLSPKDVLFLLCDDQKHPYFVPKETP